MTCGPAGIFDAIMARGPVRALTDDRAVLQAMLDVEAALARTQARLGLVEPEQAETIAAACAADNFDLSRIAEEAASVGNPVESLVRALRAAVGEPAAGAVHRGATSQDVLDTAAMLVARGALGAISADLEAAADVGVDLTRAHRHTLMAGRTLLQHAVPITFGLKAAGWTSALDEVALRIRDVRDRRLAVQLGGAAGTLAALDERGAMVVAGLARDLGLAEPVLPWHTNRSRPAEVAAALGTAAGVVGKVARDVVLLAQTDVREVSERSDERRGGSSSMPHKQNPVAAVAALAAASSAPGLVATLLAAMVQEHERAAGAWHAEWLPFLSLLRASGSAASWLCESLSRLEVHPERMRANLAVSADVMLSERVAAALAGPLGQSAAHDSVASAAREATSAGRPLAEVLLERPDVAAHLLPEEVGRLLDPTTYLGSSDAFIDRVLAAHAGQRSTASHGR